MKIRLEDVQRGYDAWAAKPHNAKWVRKIDGTPIANDIVVNIFNELDALSAALAVEAGAVGDIVPDHCTGAALAFEGGCLHVRKDGSGYIVVDEDDFILEDDRCEGEHGPEGSVHWIARFPAGEMTALRDFLNGQDFSALTPASSAVEGEAAAEASDIYRYCGADAYKWAEQFRLTAMKLGYSDMDHGWLIGWFANAIEHSITVRCPAPTPAVDDLLKQNEWLKTRLAELQLPGGKQDHDNREKWLLECGMPASPAPQTEGDE